MLRARPARVAAIRMKSFVLLHRHEYARSIALFMRSSIGWAVVVLGGV